MARDWVAVAEAMKGRLAELDMTQAELVQRSRLAPMTIRELVHNTAQRRRSDQTLAAVSEALGWPPGTAMSRSIRCSRSAAAARSSRTAAAACSGCPPVSA